MRRNAPHQFPSNRYADRRSLRPPRILHGPVGRNQSLRRWQRRDLFEQRDVGAVRICISSRTGVRSGVSRLGFFGTLRLRSGQAPEAVPFPNVSHEHVLHSPTPAKKRKYRKTKGKLRTFLRKVLSAKGLRTNILRINGLRAQYDRPVLAPYTRNGAPILSNGVSSEPRCSSNNHAFRLSLCGARSQGIVREKAGLLPRVGIGTSAVSSRTGIRSGVFKNSALSARLKPCPSPAYIVLIFTYRQASPMPQRNI